MYTDRFFLFFLLKKHRDFYYGPQQSGNVGEMY